jgi:hypothetical protein
MTSASLSGLGARITGFRDVVVDRGARWTLAGPDNLANTRVCDAGSLHLQGHVFGNGTVAILAGADLAVSGDCDVGRLQFMPAGNGTLRLSQPSLLGSVIGGLVASDTIDLVGVVATAASFAGMNLTLSGASGAVASLHFAGSYSANAFTVASDGHGGTTVRLG